MTERALSELGGELVALHLMESPKLDQHITTYTGNTAPVVDKVSYANDTVWLDKAQKDRFYRRPGKRLEFPYRRLSGLQQMAQGSCECTLSADDLNHYQRIVVALAETIRLMAEIDERG